MNLNDYILSGQIERYVAGLMSEAEELELTMLRRKYPELETEIAAAAEIMEQYVASIAIPPPEEYKRKFKGMLELLIAEEAKADAPVLSNWPEKEPACSRAGIQFAIAIGICFVIMKVLIVVGYCYDHKYSRYSPGVYYARQNESAEARLLSPPGIRKIGIRNRLDGKEFPILLYLDTNTGETVIATYRLPVAHGNTRFRLWAIQQRGYTDLGVLHSAPGYMRLQTAQNVKGYIISFDSDKGAPQRSPRNIVASSDEARRP